MAQWITPPDVYWEGARGSLLLKSCKNPCEFGGSVRLVLQEGCSILKPFEAVCCRKANDRVAPRRGVGSDDGLAGTSSGYQSLLPASSAYRTRCLD
jgi:hypothetical protein